MIYIYSEKKDLVTDLVVEWLTDKGKVFKRFNNDEFVDSKTRISNSENHIEELNDATKIWQRRGTLNFMPNQIFQNYPNRLDYIKYVSKEVNTLTKYQEYVLKDILKENYIGSLQKETDNNKLINLAIAKEIGFNIPNSLVTTSKKELTAFYDQYKPIISKDLCAPVFIRTRHKNVISAGVKMIDEQAVESLEEIFIPVYLQEYIEKKYEVRAFVVCGKIYAMAIFSQNDTQTKVDFRNYNTVKPNRCVPVKLPEAIETKVWGFLKAIDVNTGSIDLILTPSGKYYFLEINPMGQFHWLSQNCNYQVEKEIAKFLCDEKN